MRIVSLRDFATVLAVAASCLARPALAQARPPAVEPIVLLSDGRVAACGARATFSEADGVIVLDVMLRRKGDGADLVLGGSWHTPQGRARSIDALTLSTATVHTKAFAIGAPVMGASGREVTAPAADPRVTTLIQELMVSGGSIEIAVDGASPRSLVVPGPIPHATRSLYLNCAGDLFRPGE
ncbi:MAG: hypothetical protein ACT4N2_04635 [Hyphomicrobium sp.]